MNTETNALKRPRLAMVWSLSRVSAAGLLLLVITAAVPFAVIAAGPGDPPAKGDKDEAKTPKTHPRAAGEKPENDHDHDHESAHDQEAAGDRPGAGKLKENGGDRDHRKAQHKGHAHGADHEDDHEDGQGKDRTNERDPAPDRANADSHDGHDHDGHGEGGTKGGSLASDRAKPDSHDGHDHDKAGAGLAVPESVRKSLGIRFSKVELRPISRTLRVPGSFESLPSRTVELHSPVAGAVTLLVAEYGPVTSGTVLFRVESPDWREMQSRLGEAVKNIERAWQTARLVRGEREAIGLHARRLEDEERVWVSRVKQLRALIAAGSGAATELAHARSQLTETRTRLAKVSEEQAKVRTELAELELQLASARRMTPLLFADTIGEPLAAGPRRIDVLLARAAALSRRTVEELRRNVGTEAEPIPLWSTLDKLEFRAPVDGVISDWGVRQGTWVAAGGHIGRLLDTRALRFRAIALQSDLGRLRDGQRAWIVSPRGDPDLTGRLSATLRLAPTAHPFERKIELLMALPEADPKRPIWARPGVAAEALVIVAGSSRPERVVPNEAVVRDGLETFAFVRDPKQPDRVQRRAIRTGIDDGRWVSIGDSLPVGAEVVTQGAWPLLLATSGRKSSGGHVHPDGTIHNGKD